MLSTRPSRYGWSRLTLLWCLETYNFSCDGEAQTDLVAPSLLHKLGLGALIFGHCTSRMAVPTRLSFMFHVKLALSRLQLSDIGIPFLARVEKWPRHVSRACKFESLSSILGLHVKGVLARGTVVRLIAWVLNSLHVPQTCMSDVQHACIVCLHILALLHMHSMSDRPCWLDGLIEEAYY